MGLIGRVLSYAYRVLGADNVADIKLDSGGGANTTAWHAEPANQTSRPLASDLVVVVPIPGQGRQVAVAFIDRANPQDILEGEHKSYARDAAGAVKCQALLKNDGQVLITNAMGSFTLEAGGNVVINGVTIDTSGNIFGAADVTASGTVEGSTVEGTSSLKGAGVEHVGHVHAGVTTGGGSTAPIT